MYISQKETQNPALTFFTNGLPPNSACKINAVWCNRILFKLHFDKAIFLLGTCSVQN